ncbi:MAG: 4-hydroxy-tetrahydrodipicolinate reductase [Lachnospiraceae bacterium]|nr:4-hydroxy-tetrahydrodipicolinate reductase [Lachnospiraceae bacterium]
MVKMIMHGCNGRMGQMITGIVEKDPEIEIVAGVDIYDKQLNSYPVFKTIDDVNVDADVVVDFGAVAAIDGLLSWCEKTNTPCVVCTTGLSEEQINNVTKVSNSVAMLRSANMSLGINTLIKLLKEATKVFAGAGFDVEIVEKHHRMKLDAPSGTAIALADAVNEAVNNEYTYVYDRSTRREQRPDKEIGISAVRGGTIVGDHDVIFAGEDEVITFSHTAYSRAVFGKGAIQAAKFLCGKAPGLYTMADVVE